jgi:cellulase/cellobiase CelA1
LSCKISYVITSQWPGFFGVNLTITNTGTTVIQGWTLTFTFANGQQIFNGWNGRFSQHGAQVSITNADFNGTLPAGSSTTLGFQATSHGTNSKPTVFTLNGISCQ